MRPTTDATASLWAQVGDAARRPPRALWWVGPALMTCRVWAIGGGAGPAGRSTIVILALAQGSKNSDANPATQRALQIMMVAGVCVALGKLTRTDLISYHAQPGLCPSQPARAWSNAAILMVAKLEKVSDTAYGRTILSPWRSAPQV